MASGFEDEKGPYFRRRRRWRHQTRFVVVASLLCFLGGLLAFSVYWMFQSAPPFLYGPYKDLQKRDIETLDRIYREREKTELERMQREESFRERRGESYEKDIYGRR